MQASGVEQLVRLLLHDASFARAVQQRDGEAAAAAAVGLVRSHFKAFANVLRPATALDSGSPTAAVAGGRRLSDVHGHHHGSGTMPSTAARRLSDPGALTTPQKWTDLRVKDRVVINISHKRSDTDTMGKQGVVSGVAANGWVKVQVGSEVLDFQMRHLSLLPRGGSGSGAAGGPGRGSWEPKITLKGAGSRAAGAGGAGSAGQAAGAAATPGAAAGGSAGAAAGSGPRRSEAVKAMRRELVALEEDVPWREVSERWRAVRQRWCKAVRCAETSAALAQLMGELHDHLRTDKSSGLFAAGGAWEVALGACARGEANHVQLANVWEDMRGGLRAWLAAGSLPGGLEGLDPASYEQALATYALLQEAAMAGPDALEQVPLDQILTTQRDVLALQHIIQREMAATHGKLQALATGSAALPAAAQQPLALPDLTGGDLSEALLMQLGKLPRLRSAAAAAAGDAGDAAVDTDKDSGSDATDVGELDLMDTTS